MPSAATDPPVQLFDDPYQQGGKFINQDGQTGESEGEKHDLDATVLQTPQEDSIMLNIPQEDCDTQKLNNMQIFEESNNSLTKLMK